jgi:hypothetical protein
MTQYNLRGIEVPSGELLGALQQIAGSRGYEAFTKTKNACGPQTFGIPKTQSQLIIKENGHGPKGLRGLTRKLFGKDIIATIEVPDNQNVSSMEVRKGQDYISSMDHALMQHLQRTSGSYRN